MRSLRVRNHFGAYTCRQDTRSKEGFLFDGYIYLWWCVKECIQTRRKADDDDGDRHALAVQRSDSDIIAYLILPPRFLSLFFLVRNGEGLFRNRASNIYIYIYI